MFKSKKIKSIVLFLTLFSGMSLFAQNTLTKDASSTTEVKDAELQKFADVYQKVQEKNQEAQQEMMTSIKKEGLTVQRYTELRRAQDNPDSKVKPTADEKAKTKRLDAKIQKLEPELQKQQTIIIKDSGLTMDRYQEIAKVLNSDRELQQKFQGILMKQQTGK